MPSFLTSNIIRNTLSRPRFSRALGAIALLALTSLAAVPAYAISCEDVRNLTSAEQEYWAKKLNLTGEQKHSIWLARYKNYRPDRAKPEEIVQR